MSKYKYIKKDGGMSYPTIVDKLLKFGNVTTYINKNNNLVYKLSRQKSLWSSKNKITEIVNEFITNPSIFWKTRRVIIITDNSYTRRYTYWNTNIRV